LAAFGKDRKLRKTDEFSSVFRFKCLLRGRYLDLYLRPNTLDFPRLGLIVPKRVLARAVDRNQVRRIMRELFRLRQGNLGAMDVIMRLKQSAPNASENYRGEGAELLDRARQFLDKKSV
jgi:ribonuclease P protein component